MTRKTTLSVVSPDAPPPAPAQPKTLVEAVEGGDYREILLAQQREIAATVGDEKGPAKAALHRQLAAISKELEALNVAAKEEAAEHADVADQAFDPAASL